MTKQRSKSIQVELTGPGSALQKYRDRMVGRSTFSAFLFFEFNECFILPLPGNIGFKLRAFFLPFLLGGMDRSVRLASNIQFRRPGRVFLRAGTRVATQVLFNVKCSKGTIELAQNVRVGKATIFSCYGGKIDIGADTMIGNNCRIGSMQGMKIGRSCKIGDECYLIGAAHQFDNPDIPIIQQPLSCRGATTIGDHVHIGDEVTIMDGVTIGHRVTIPDKALIRKDIRSGVVVDQTGNIIESK